MPIEAASSFIKESSLSQLKEVTIPCMFHIFLTLKCFMLKKTTEPTQNTYTPHGIPVALPSLFMRTSTRCFTLCMFVYAHCQITFNYISIKRDTTAIKHQKFLPSCAFLSQLSVDFLGCFSLVQYIYIPYADSTVSDLPVL